MDIAPIFFKVSLTRTKLPLQSNMCNLRHITSDIVALKTHVCPTSNESLLTWIQPCYYHVLDYIQAREIHFLDCSNMRYFPPLYLTTQ